MKGGMVCAGPPNLGTPVMSTHKYQRQGGSARPSPMSTTTLGPRIHDPSVFTVTDRRVSLNPSNPHSPACASYAPICCTNALCCCTWASKPMGEVAWLIAGGC